MQGKSRIVKGQDSDPRTFGQRLRLTRESIPLSQADLGELIGSHQDTVARWERGEAKPRASSLTQLARALNTTVGWLRNGGDELPPLREVTAQVTGRLGISGGGTVTVRDPVVPYGTGIVGVLNRLKELEAAFHGTVAELEALVARADLRGLLKDVDDALALADQDHRKRRGDQDQAG